MRSLMTSIFCICCGFALLTLAGCPNPADDDDTPLSPTPPPTRDVDEDGYNDQAYGGEDCDDTNADIHPDALEVCDEIDNNCDGTIDEGLSTTYYADWDADGYGDPTVSSQKCGPEDGVVTNGDDCDDSNMDINPGADELCDGLDNNCDGTPDEGATDVETFYPDLDRDGHGDASAPIVACAAPPYHITDSSDCDDADPDTNPDAEEVCDGADNDCDTEVDEEVLLAFYQDLDGDGFGDLSQLALACKRPSGYVDNYSDCDDSLNTVYPGATEVCDTLDNDCDTEVDEGVLETFYMDLDHDGHGDPESSVTSCTPPPASAFEGDDCDDTEPTVYVDAEEQCDGLDNDCDLEVDEGVLETFYVDSDGDGYGDSEATSEACSLSEGFAAEAGDCDDHNATVYPGAEEVCDLLDNDCDAGLPNGGFDEGVKTKYYQDADQDGYGDPDVVVEACETPEGYVDRAGDCDDGDTSVNKGAAEVCDGIDNDCDVLVDEGVKETFYADADHDGYGSAIYTTQACAAPPGYVDNDEDCDDTKGTRYPGAPELCDQQDNDCDDEIDESATTQPFYLDNDNDGYGDAGSSIQACIAPTGYVPNANDCDDAEPAINPQAREVCNGIDDDCDDLIDDEDSPVANPATWYLDADEDAYGDPTVSTKACLQPEGYVANASDCNDADAGQNPDSVWYLDYDQDGYGNPSLTLIQCTKPVRYVSNADDCGDTNAQVNPFGTEVCDGLDNNCNGATDEDSAEDAPTWYLDADADGFGAESGPTRACALPEGYANNADDCNDQDPAINPDAHEICDGIDNNCDEDADSGAIGEGALCAGLDCLEIIIENPAAPNGVYWIQPELVEEPYQVYCDMTSSDGGWTLVANVDDVNDRWFRAFNKDAWEMATLRNENVFPTLENDVTVTTKYLSWSTIPATDLRIVYKNDDKFFQCNDLTVNQPLNVIFSTIPSPNQCGALCGSISQDRFANSATTNPIGLNCSDPNEGWLYDSPQAENARIGGLDVDNTCCVMNAWLGAAGDRGYSTSELEKTWGEYSSGAVYDNNIMVFIR